MWWWGAGAWWWLGLAVAAGIVARAAQERRQHHAVLAVLDLAVPRRGFGDALAAWSEADAAGRGDPAVRGWLAGDLAADLRALPPPRSLLPRLRLGWVRYCVPLFVVLLLLWLLLPDLELPVP